MTVIHRRPRLWAAAAALALLVLLFAAAPALANTATPNVPESPNADAIKSLYFGVLGICLTIFVLVGGWLLYTAVRFRERRGDTHEPPQTHGSTRLEIGWTVVPILIVVGILVFAFIKLPSAEKISSNAMKVKVTAQQFSFSYTYPSGKRAGRSHHADPAGQPAGEALVTSKDVAHDWWVPTSRPRSMRSPAAPTTPGSRPTRSARSWALRRVLRHRPRGHGHHRQGRVAGRLGYQVQGFAELDGNRAAPAAPCTPRPSPAEDNGLWSWITTVDHKRIGLMYLVLTFLFFLIGGIFALVIRLQLEHTSNTLISAEAYDQIMTMHGTTMIFLFVVPVMAGFGNYLVPLQIGARDMAFPRLNALSFWLLLFGALVLYTGFVWGGGPADSGWTSYPPLSVQSPGHGQDLWIVGLHIIGISSLIGAINFICTIHHMRAPGMRLSRMPLFTWTIEIYSIMIVVAGPVLAGALTMLLLDRNYGTNFYNPDHARQRAALPAPVLVLLAPGRVRDGAAGLRHDLRDPAGVLAQAALRLPGAGLLDRRDRLPRVPRVGPPHVRGRLLGAGADLVHVRVAG